MAFVQMTDEEKALLDLAYTDGKRILEGMLFDYQEKALSELRDCREFLKNRYPNVKFKIISFQPSSRKGCVEMQFIQAEKDEKEYLLKYENGRYSDNFYDVPYEREYDEIIENMLAEAGISARVYTYFPFLISDEIRSGRDLLNHRPRLGRHSALFLNADVLPDREKAEIISEQVIEVFKDNGIYSSGILFFIPGMDQLKTKTVLELDAYCRKPENRKKISSKTFSCFDVER